MELSEFLLARIAEDEAVARKASGGLDFNWGDYGINPDLLVDALFFERFASPSRVLADCEAKRRVVDEHHNVNDGDCGTCVRGQWGYPTHGGAIPEHWPCPTLRLLTLPYADHPDYDEEWKP